MTQLASFSVVMPIADWVDYFGKEWPTKAECQQGRLRPWGRTEDGKVIAQCVVNDETRDRRVLAKIRARPGGPSLKEVCERSEVYGGPYPKDRFKKLPAKYHGIVLRVRVFRSRQPSVHLEKEIKGRHGKPGLTHHEMAQDARKLHKEKKVSRRLVRMADYQPGDVIEMTHLHPGRIAGE
jgi:hypothetical protein